MLFWPHGSVRSVVAAAGNTVCAPRSVREMSALMGFSLLKSWQVRAATNFRCLRFLYPVLFNLFPNFSLFLLLLAVLLVVFFISIV